MEYLYTPLAVLLVISTHLTLVASQCSPDSDMYLEQGETSCYHNYTVFNERTINMRSSGVRCTKRGSASTDVQLLLPNGAPDNCFTGSIRCEPGAGTLLLYTSSGFNANFNGFYGCCIDGDCIYIGIVRSKDYNSLYTTEELSIKQCSVVPPTDFINLPQLYTVTMTTDNIRPTRLVPLISLQGSTCEAETSIMCGTPYYTYQDEASLQYQYSLPVVWDGDDDSFITHDYTCTAKFDGNSVSSTATISAPDGVPSNIAYSVMNETAIAVKWSSDATLVNGFTLRIFSDQESISYQVPDPNARDFVIEGIQPEIIYTIELRAYYELLGSPRVIFPIELPSSIDALNHTILTVANPVQAHCYTRRVDPTTELTWLINGTPISHFNYAYVQESILLGDRSYRNSLDILGTYIGGLVVTCAIDVNGIHRSESITLEAPSSAPEGLTVDAITPDSITISWQSVDVSGFGVIHNNGFKLITDREATITGLTLGEVYNVSVFSYIDLQSSSATVSILLDAPNKVSELVSRPINSTSIAVSWLPPTRAIVSGYIMTYTVLCSGYTGRIITDASQNKVVMTQLQPGLELSLSVQATNNLGVGEGLNITGTPYGERPSEAPQIQDVTVLNATSVLVTWQPPDCTSSNGNITGYFMEYASADDRKEKTTVNLSYVLTDLVPLMEYSFTVAAVNVNGTGPPGQASIIIIEMPQNNDRNAIIVAVCIVAVFILVVVTMVIVLPILYKYRKRLRGKHSISGVSPAEEVFPTTQCTMTVTSLKSDHNGEYSSFDGVDINSSIDPLYSITSECVHSSNVLSHEYANTSDCLKRFDHQIPSLFPICTTELGSWVAELHKNSNRGFTEQYENIPKVEKTTKIGFKPSNRMLNHFKNITVYDDNRIILDPLLRHTDCQRDYINASYIDGYSIAKSYIAAQGPIPGTLIDFWRMIWQERPQIIVMVTNVTEGSMIKCEQYWPTISQRTMMVGPFTITITEEQVLMDYVVRSMEVEAKGMGDIFQLKQFQFTSWPDHGVPETVSPLRTLFRRVKKAWRRNSSPLLVHCSAGVGRTGTFITLDMALEQASTEGTVDIVGIVSRLRQQRMKMVQTVAQLSFIYDAVLETIIAGNTEIPSDKFFATLNDWKQLDPVTQLTPLTAQFQLLSQLTPSPADVLVSTAKSHPHKNRPNHSLPYEKYRVSLKNEYPDYIHASFVQGYRTKKAFIIAQSPMINTVRDFWKMIMDNEVSAIVMCCELHENQKEVCYPYWDAKIYGEYHISTVIVDQISTYTKRKFSIQNSKTRGTWSVAQLQIHDWSSDGHIKRPQTVIQVIEDVLKAQQRTGGGPVVVHCSDTVSRSGVYCAVSNAIEQCKMEGIVDVFQAVKAVKINRPGAVVTLEQYTSAHEIVSLYLDMNNTYSNFNVRK